MAFAMEQHHQQTGYVYAEPDKQTLEQAVSRAEQQIIADQHPEGYWLYELEADCTIPAEYIFFMHFMNEIKDELQQKIANYIRRNQNHEGGWSLYHGGQTDISCSVKAYYALKLAGDDINDAHMQAARNCILSYGGAAKSNVFTLIMLALFEQVPWRATPYMPVEFILFPKWSPFQLGKMSYWSRTVVVPLLIIYSFRPKAANPNQVDVQELFITPPEEETEYLQVRSFLNRIFIFLDKLGKFCNRFIPRFVRNKALSTAENWMIDRLNGEDGLGGIFPAQMNSYIALDLLGYEKDHPLKLQVKRSLEKLLVHRTDEAYCQPCLSPVWDTGLAGLALQQAAKGAYTSSISNGCQWLAACQLEDEPGDWKDKRPALVGGGWPFQFANSYYPDLDDTAVIACLMYRTGQEKYSEPIERAADWLLGMQSKNGGFAAFDVDNNAYYLNEIPFADHGALLDPPTVDVSARCLMLFAELGREKDQLAIKKCLKYIRKEQEEDGSWFGRWGTNYIYGTWSVLMAMEYAATPREQKCIEKAVEWLKRIQREDGGWGESNGSYYSPKRKDRDNVSNTYHTALAVLGLLSVGVVDDSAVTRGIQYIIQHQEDDGLWSEPWYTAPGFPRVFYLKYYGYTKYFPLWALAKYRNLKYGH